MDSITVGPATMNGSGTVSGWRQRFAFAWRVLVYGQIRFTLTAESLTITPERAGRE